MSEADTVLHIARGQIEYEFSMTSSLISGAIRLEETIRSKKEGWGILVTEVERENKVFNVFQN
jgi:hypothetical protein